MFVNRGCTFGQCLGHVLDIRWRQINIAIGLLALTLLFELPPLNFRSLHELDKIWILLYLWIYMFIHLWHCSWSYKFWRYMKFTHCNHTFALSYWICIWRNRSRIGAVSTSTATHVEIIWLQPSLHSLGFVGISEIMHCTICMCIEVLIWLFHIFL